MTQQNPQSARNARTSNQAALRRVFDGIAVDRGGPKPNRATRRAAAKAKKAK